MAAFVWNFLAVSGQWRRASPYAASAESDGWSAAVEFVPVPTLRETPARGKAGPASAERQQFRQALASWYSRKGGTGWRSIWPTRVSVSACADLPLGLPTTALAAGGCRLWFKLVSPSSAVRLTEPAERTASVARGSEGRA